ncbi:MAG: hypothetical protein FWC97_08780, partial [Treponema sp.]|nr:hypothetical protein [Treponema sp.]
MGEACLLGKTPGEFASDPLRVSMARSPGDVFPISHASPPADGCIPCVGVAYCMWGDSYDGSSFCVHSVESCANCAIM